MRKNNDVNATTTGGNGMKKGLVIAALALQCASAALNAGLTLGNTTSGFWVNDGTLNLNGKTVTRGTIRDTGGEVQNATALVETVIEKTGGTGATTIDRIQVTGGYADSGAVTLNADKEILTIDAGSAMASVIAGGAATMTTRIQGNGDLRGGITVGTGNTADSALVQLEMDLRGTVSQNITFNPGDKTANEGTVQLTLLNDLELADDATLEITGTPTNYCKIDCNGNMFSFGSKALTITTEEQVMRWSDANIVLNAPLTLGHGADPANGWKFIDAGVMNGNGNELALSLNASDPVLIADTSLTFVDMHLTGMKTDGITITGSLVFYDTTLKDAAQTGHVRLSDGTTITAGDGDLFGTSTTFATHPATIEFLSTVTLGSGVVWTFSQDATVNAHGNVFDLTDGAAGFTVDDTKTLKLSNAVLIVDDSTVLTVNGALELSDCTIIVQESISMAGNGDVTITGPTTVVTGAKLFTPPATGTHTINGVTLWYDTLGTADDTNVRGTWGGSGQLASVSANASTGDLPFTAASSDLEIYRFLFPTDSGVSGRHATFDNAVAALTFNGHGRSFIMADTDISGLSADAKTLLRAQGDATHKVTLTNITLDGVLHEHFKTAASSADPSAFIFGDGTSVRLQKDDVIGAVAYTFDDGDSAATMTLDLNGHTLDLGTAGLNVRLEDAASLLIIKNGRIKGVSGTLLDGDNDALVGPPAIAPHAGTIRLLDVDVELEADASLSRGLWEIAGTTRFMVSGLEASGGTEGGAHVRTLTLAATATKFTVLDGATMILCNGVTYAHAHATADTFQLGTTATDVSSSATLKLIGATFDVTAQNQTIERGRLVFDHISTLKVVTGKTLSLGDGAKELDIVIMPAAQVKLTGEGTVSYDN